MAKKKHVAKRRTQHRRHRVGAVNKSMLTEAAGAIAGYVVGSMLQSKLAPNMNQKVKGSATILIGLFGVPMLLKNDLGKGLAMGMVVSGGKELLTSFGVISGTRPALLPPSNQARMIAGSGVPGFVNGAGSGVPGFVNGVGRRKTTARGVSMM